MVNSKKGREKRRWNSLFCCFGSSGEREVINKDEKNMKLVKYIVSSKKSSRRGKTVPIGESTLTTSPEVVNPSKGIRVVVEAEIEKVVKKKTNKLSAPSLTNQLSTNKEIVLKKSSSVKDISSTTQEARSNYPTNKVLSHSVSMPPTRMRKEKAAAAVGGRQKQKNDLYGGEYYLDPIVGAFIIMVTLVVMLIWGKVIAILSTTAWFYFVPRLVRTNNSSESPHAIKVNNASNQINLDSPEYKKKVVLQGLLERNQHGSIL